MTMQHKVIHMREKEVLYQKFKDDYENPARRWYNAVLAGAYPNKYEAYKKAVELNLDPSFVERVMTKQYMEYK